MLRLGTVPYLNALPLVVGLDDTPGVQLVAAVPSQLAPMLRVGALDLALVSAIELFRDPPLSYYPGPAITSCGPVRSINLYLRRPVDEIQRLGLDTSSLTAAAMTQVCLTRFLGCGDYVIVPAPPHLPLSAIDADAVLRIGDPALATQTEGLDVLDLGAVWTENTGLPFVYALWLAGSQLASGTNLDVLAKARDRGLAQRPALAKRFAEEHDLPEALCHDYLAHSIGYTLGPDEQAGLALFGRYAHELGLADRETMGPALC
ncbi:MAG: chorismate dehydratase [Pseudohongiellaceae bacterium]|jgi:chorismate dehydratase